MGLRRRVSFGFISIVGVLVLSGMVSFFELNTLSNSTEDILGSNRRYRVLASQMNEALREHSDAFVQIAAFGNFEYDSLCRTSITQLDTLLNIAKRESLVPEVVDTLMITAANLRRVSEEFLAAPRNSDKYSALIEEFPELDSLSADFTVRKYEEYKPLVRQMMRDIEYYYDMSQSSLSPSTEQLNNNAYRSVTPVLISLIVMIAIVLMLYFFILLYCVAPVVRMNQSLKDFLTFKIPYAPKGERRDEMQELNERIDALIKQSRMTKSSGDEN